MSETFDPIAFAGVEQRRATTPGHSAWVEANAGTGKTKVLTDRVARLLLADAQPERILCLTFTKAAAAEMRNRLAAKLGRWAMADDAVLDRELESLSDRAPERLERIHARRLFARVLDAPGGINILTIHAFCQALLKRFPLEAGIAPGFEVLDEAEADAILRRIQNEQLEVLARSDAPRGLAEALATVSGRVSVAEYAELMGKLLGERAWLLARIADEAGLKRVRRRLARMLDCDEPFARRPDEIRLRAAAQALIRAGKSDGLRGQAMAEWLESQEDRAAAITDAYRSVFFTDRGELRKTLATKGATALLPGIDEILRIEADRLGPALDHANACALVELTMALLQLGLDITQRYDDAKRRRAALDYDDLVLGARRLLERTESAAWVLYKLDGGIDHVLVDEAQDTNPDQWDVIQRLTEEFFVGQGAVDRPRTVFAVGDTKQSIFGFQRADPRKLADMRTRFADKSRLASKPFVPVALTVSFRSTPAVLSAIDWVFSLPQAARGVDSDVLHLASRKEAPGIVELWPLVASDKGEIDTTSYATPQDPQRMPHERLARLIAAHAGSLIGRERRAHHGELLHEGHFMVLVRRRNEFVNALVQAFKRRGIEVAGVDRLDLAEELAIKDLLAMARFVLLPQDDLNLACLLKSPLIGLDEEQLFALAANRPGRLWHALRERAGEPGFADAYRTLSGWLGRADYATPFDFFAEALGPEGGRRRLLERLGREASDPIDELLARTLQYQRADAGSLQGFLRWFEAGGCEIKRDLDQNRRREVRILTVHASKGLQAPIVYLPDTTRVPNDPERLLSDEGGRTRLWIPRADDASAQAHLWRKAARDRSLEEQNRLLYVAMSRAEDRLYIGGWIGKRVPDSGCWYERIHAGLAASIEGASCQPRQRAIPKTFDFTPLVGEQGWLGDGFELTNEGRIEIPSQQELAIPECLALPRWVETVPLAEPDPPAPLAPSQPLPDERQGPPRAYSPLGAAGDARRWQRGRLMHELLLHLPRLAPVDRAAAARRFLAQPAHALDDAVIEQWVAETLAVTEAPAHAKLFAPDSRAEVPLIGSVITPRGTFTVSGQVDRLAVSPSEVAIVDFKTNRPPPSSVAEVPLAYRRQLALYRALLGHIYPGRTVRAFLLWTSTPLLMELDAELLDRSMPYAAAP